MISRKKLGLIVCKDVSSREDAIFDNGGASGVDGSSQDASAYSFWYNSSGTSNQIHPHASEGGTSNIDLVVPSSIKAISYSDGNVMERNILRKASLIG